MGLSSKLAACICLGTLLLDPAQAATAGRAGHAAVIGPFVPARIQPRPLPSVHAGGLGRRPTGRRLRGGYGFGGLGLAGLGLDTLDDGLDSGPGPAFAGEGAPPPIDPGSVPLPPPVVLPLPPACPLIIKVGSGLAHPAKTQILYGRPICRR